MEELKERVYLTLTGNLIPSYRVPGVEDAYAKDAFCLKQYSKMLDAYERLCERLGTGEEEDDDVEIIINSLLDIEKCLSMKMYEYGAIFGNKTKEEVCGPDPIVPIL